MDRHDDEIFTGDFVSKKLRAVPSGALTGLAPEKKMDASYFTTFESCNWDDKNFVDGSPLFMGSSRVPLSASALQSLLTCTNPSFKIKEIADPISSLLLGWPDEKAPIQILHQSLRDFLAVRAQSRFSINEREHSQRLALCCLSILVRDLSPNIPCAGFIDGDEEGVPKMAEGAVSEELWYACRFGLDHVADVDTPDDEFTQLLREFLSTKLVLWMEVVASKGSFLSLAGARKWIKVGRVKIPSECV